MIMTKDFTQEIIDAIRGLYQSDQAAQALFDWTAQRERDASSTSINRICKQLGISRGDAVALARRLEGTKCGEFIVGRRGQKSRFCWFYSCISLGQAAAGESSNIEEAKNPISEAEDDVIELSEIGDDEGFSSKRITIAEAKIALANSLGISINSIEIIIKA
jgi:DNA-binding MarR family transcriptional regulator